MTCQEWKEFREERIELDRRWVRSKREFLEKIREWIDAVKLRVCDNVVGDEACCQLISEFETAYGSYDVFDTAEQAILNYFFLVWSVSCSAPCWQASALEADLYYDEEVKKWLDKVQGHIDHWLRFVEDLLKNGCALKNVPVPSKNVPPVFTPLPPG